MKLPSSSFTVTDWSIVPPQTYLGESGEASERALNLGDLRVRMVKYTPGYLADHWCDRGHVLLVLKGEIEIELRDGRMFRLSAGMSFEVSDFGDSPHRLSTRAGAIVFIVD